MESFKCQTILSFWFAWSEISTHEWIQQLLFFDDKQIIKPIKILISNQSQAFRCTEVSVIQTEAVLQKFV